MNIIKKYNHEGVEYLMTFENRGDELMINASEMAKPFGKRTNDFLRLKQTKSFIDVLENRNGNSRNRVKVVEVIKGNTNQGTWMCEKLALKFGAWLSAEFELWVYDQIHELLTTGNVTLKTSSLVNLEAHLDHITQKNNSKAINHKISLEGSGYGRYNRDSCIIHSNTTPRDLMKVAKEKNLPSKNRTSGKEVLRTVAPIIACKMSLTDNYISSNPNLSINDLEYVYNNITSKAEPLFKAMLAHDAKPIELNQK